MRGQIWQKQWGQPSSLSTCTHTVKHAHKHQIHRHRASAAAAIVLRLKAVQLHSSQRFLCQAAFSFSICQSTEECVNLCVCVLVHVTVTLAVLSTASQKDDGAVK